MTWKTGWGLSTYKIAVDTLQGRSADRVDVTATVLGAKAIQATDEIRGKSVYVPNAAGDAGQIVTRDGFTGVGATGFSWAAGQHWTQKGLPYFNMQATDDTQNLHIWMRRTDFGDRGLIYNEPDGKWVIRTGGQKTIVFENEGDTYFPGKTRALGMIHSQRANPGLDANTYGNTNFQAEATNGSIPGVGFHRAGIEGGALVYYSGQLRLRRNDNQEFEMLNHGNLMPWIANQMRYEGIGAIASMQNVSGQNFGGNATVGGGSLRYASHNSGAGPAPSGSWLNLGWSAANGVSVWLRYA